MSARQKQKAFHNTKDKWMDRAVEVYRGEEGKENRRSLKKICRQVEEECLDTTGKIVKLSSSTLQRHVNGGRSQREAHEEQRWLNNEEVEVVIQDIISYAERGMPLSHRRIKDHVDQICRARYGDRFPETGVGKEWTKRFTSDHSDRISAYWSKGLDRSCARAVNPVTKAGYFELLQKVIKGDGGADVIPSELIYGIDESGFQKGVGGKERVFGGKGKQCQYQQWSGDRENITVIVTICGDGISTAPAVIFKGEGFQVNWKQNNPANAS
jgi:hypothetical protein